MNEMNYCTREPIACDKPEKITNVKDIYNSIALNLNELDYKEDMILSFLTGAKPDGDQTQDCISFIQSMTDVERQTERLNEKIEAIARLLGVSF